MNGYKTITLIFCLLISINVTAKYLSHKSIHEKNASSNVYVTFYGSPDNSPPGGNIDSPCIHSKAGGIGTFSDPITFAVQTGNLPKCQLIYYPTLQKYFILEDSCTGCGPNHVDLWAGYGTNPGIANCEDKLTRNDQIIISPVSNLPVDLTPIWNEATQTCVTPGTPPPPPPPPPPPQTCLTPTNVKHVVSSGSVTITWSAPSNSLPISSYEIENYQGQTLYKGITPSYTGKLSGFFHVYFLYSECENVQSRPAIIYFVF